MKKLFLLFFALCPLITFGQTATEAQKDEALGAAIKFCSLLPQFSNGGVTYLSNDRKIFELCSTPKISTFDDINSQKEVMLNSYLALITKKYKNHLRMTFSAPIITESYAIPSFETTTGFISQLGDIGNVGTVLNKVGSTDIYIVIEVKQNIPALRKETIRQIIYSTGEKKIISFSNRNSPYVSFCKALDAYDKQKYSESLSLCNKALAGERFDKKGASSVVALMDKLQLASFHDISQYTMHIGEWKEPVECLFNCLDALNTDNYSSSIELMKKLITYKWAQEVKADFQALLASLYACGLGGEKDQTKALYWYRAAVKNGSASAGYLMMLDNMSDNLDIEDGELRNALQLSADKGYIPSYYLIALFDANEGRQEQEGLWYKKGAEQGDLMGMIYYGCWLSAIKHNKQQALFWLRKAANDPNLATYLANRQLTKQGMKTAEDIKQLVYKVEHDIAIPAPVPVGNENAQQASSSTISTTTSNTSSTTYTPTTSSTSSHSRYKTKVHRDFNCPDDEQGVFGFSVGYVQKQWAVKEEGETNKMGYWDDTKHLSGIQAGFRVEPLFKYGFGIDTGLYYEYYHSKSKPISYDGIEFEPTLNEHSLYLPVHLEYRLNFSKEFQLFFYGGIGLDYVLSAKLKTNHEDLSYDEDDAYDNASLKKFNTSLEYGGGFRIYGVQVNFTLANGMLNIYKESGAEIKQNKNLMCNLSYMF